jgi:hypothetical protein
MNMQPLAVVSRSGLPVMLAVTILQGGWGDAASAQARRPRVGAPGSVQALDNRGADLERDYLTGLLQLAGDYEEAGDMEKARETLQAILRLKPDTESVRERLEEMDEAAFDANSTSVEVDSARSWVATGVAVTREQPIRLASEGSYRFIVNDTVGPGGFATQDALQEMAAGVPAGALMGIIIPAPRPGQRQPPEPGAPFAIGEGLEFTSDVSGALLLRVNTPPGAKCIGKLRVTISGNIRPVQ